MTARRRTDGRGGAGRDGGDARNAAGQPVASAGLHGSDTSGAASGSRRPDGSARVATALRRVRIIGGRWRRTPVAVPDVAGLRPTPDRVRETLFNWLGARIEGLRCLDLFAGTGVLGLEAASRGAKRVLLVERDRRAREAIGRMAARLDPDGVVVEVAGGDALERLRRLAAAGERFDLVFVDPPFAADQWHQTLAGLPAILAPDALVYLECDASFALPADWQPVRTARAGQVRYHLLRYAGPGLPAPDSTRELCA